MFAPDRELTDHPNERVDGYPPMGAHLAAYRHEGRANGVSPRAATGQKPIETEPTAPPLGLLLASVLGAWRR